MSILNVNQIQPVGGGNTITVNASDVSASGVTITASSFVGPVTGNVTGNVTSSSTSTFSSGINVTGGRVLIGTNTARAIGGESNSRLQIEGSGATSNSWVNISRFANSGGSAVIQFGKSRSDTPGTYTVVQNNDTLGSINFAGADGTEIDSSNNLTPELSIMLAIPSSL